MPYFNISCNSSVSCSTFAFVAFLHLQEKEADTFSNETFQAKLVHFDWHKFGDLPGAAELAGLKEPPGGRKELRAPISSTRTGLCISVKSLQLDVSVQCLWPKAGEMSHTFCLHHSCEE